MVDSVVSNMATGSVSVSANKFGSSLITISPFSSSILKLNNENFLVWKSQILPILRGHKLDKFVLVDEPQFMRDFVYNGTEVNDENLLRFSLEQQLWILQDQFLLGWLVAAIDVDELGDLVGLRTSRRIWVTIEETYASQSEVSMLQLRNQLQTTKKGSMKILEYCKKMKRIADQMCAGGFFVSEKELVMCILTGLGPEYETVRVSYTSRPPLPSLQEVKNYLIHYESTIDQNNIVNIYNSANLVSAFNSQLQLNNQTIPFSNPVMTSSRNVNSYSGNVNYYDSGVNKSSSQEFYDRSSYDDNRNRGSFGNFGKGRGRGRGGRNWKPQCQICGLIGHLASVCYYRDSNSGNFVFQGQNSGMQPHNGNTQSSNSQFSYLTSGLNAQFSQLQNSSIVNPLLSGGMAQMPFNNFSPGVYGNLLARGMNNVAGFGQFFNGMPLNSFGHNSAGSQSILSLPFNNAGYMNNNGCNSSGNQIPYNFNFGNSDNKSFMSNFPGQASAHLATTPIVVGDPNWYLDSGATNHVVTDGDSLLQQLEYNGNNKLLVGNGQGLDITSVGQADGTANSQKNS